MTMTKTKILRSVLSAVALSVFLLPVSALSESEDERFEALAARYVDEKPALSPVKATDLGDHRYDDLLDHVGEAAKSRALAFYIRFRADLAAIEWQSLSRANQVDAALLRHELDKRIWTDMELEEWRWNPLVYTDLSGLAVYGLMARDFAPLEQRLMNVASRLRQMPRFFAEVRQALEPARVPRIHAETAVKQNRGVLANIDGLVIPAADVLSAGDRKILDQAIEIARDAVAEHQLWLQDMLVPGASGDFRIGAALFDAKLHFALNSALGRREIRQRAETEFKRVRGEMYAVAQEIYRGLYPHTRFPEQAGDYFRQAVIRAALEQAYAKLPGRDEIVDVARQSLVETTAFVRENNLVRVPDDPLEIIVMPEFQRGVALAYCDSPGVLDKGQKTFYAVAPLPDEWDDTQVRSFLREYNLLSTHNLTIHEAMPGHYLQLAHSNEYPSTIRALLRSGPFIEGWAVYAERVMTDAGYRDGDPLMRLIQLKWYLRAITNATMDQAIHVDGMTRDEAMKLMIEGGFQEEREAAGKWVRAQLTSAQLSTYFVGYQEHADLRAEVERREGSSFDLRRYNDRVLSFGSPPVRYVRALMLDEPIPGPIEMAP